MKLLIKLTAVVFISSWILLAAPPVRADVNDFVITDFKADYVLTADDSQGLLKVQEEIDVVFSDNNHGILRAIPKKYKDHSVRLKIRQVSSRSGAPSQYTTYSENDNLVLKIGDPNQTVTGAQSYTIIYTAENVVTFYDGHDEFYWDVNGDQWEQPFSKTSATFALPGRVINKLDCFTGSFDATTQNCNIDSTAGDTVKTSTTQELKPNETLTMVIGMPKGIFHPAGLSDWLNDNQSRLLAIFAPPLLIGGWAYLRWRKHGRDIEGRGVIVPEYGPPDKLTPAEVGIIADYRLDNKDISATIIDLAIRKYIKIIETKTGLLKRGKKYELELINANTVGLKPHEQSILTNLFSDFAVGTVVKLEDLRTKYYTTVAQVRKDLTKDLTTHGYFEKNPLTAGKGMLTLAIFLFVLTFVFFWWISIGFALSAIILFILGNLMERRSIQGVAAKEHTEGLKLYLKTAEKDRIKMLQSPDMPYMPKVKEPKHTVHLFEKLLPYAILLGVEGQWSKQFEDIYTEPPDWYSGNYRTFNAAVFASSLSSSVSSMGSSFSAPSSSSSSGFSGGGGSAGGGGGGGGGGGW